MERKDKDLTPGAMEQIHIRTDGASPLILYEDTDMIVCHKRAGIPVQTSHLTQTDMESILKKHILSQQTERNPKNIPLRRSSPAGKAASLHIVHRLDTFVEGIVLFAKTKRCAAALSSLIRERKIEKRYRAIVTGTPPASGILEHYMKKDPRTNTAVLCDKQDPHAKYAHLTYTLLDTSEHFSRVDILLHTGRFHQIRLQFQAIGHPLAGERKYTIPANTEGFSSSAHTAAYEHVQLLAYSLRFPHPVTGKEMTFTLPDTLTLK